jgi:hypothetical protein
MYNPVKNQQIDSLSEEKNSYVYTTKLAMLFFGMLTLVGSALANPLLSPIQISLFMLL